MMPENLPPSTPMDGNQTEPLRLLPQQRALFEALTRHEKDIGTIYLGALHVIADTNNPDRVALAAHSVREMLQRLRKHLGVEMPAHDERMGDKVKSLGERWLRVKGRSSCLTEAGWTGPIDNNLKSFLTDIELFFGWHETHYPRMRQEIAQVLRKLDRSAISLPSQIEELRAQEWQLYHEFFTKVAHHGKFENHDDFLSWIFELEQYLLNRLQPRTFAEIRDIDAIIQEGELHDNS
jgi:hypothetical protein